MIKLIATGYSDKGSCEEILLDENFNIVKRYAIDGITNASFVEMKGKDTYFVSEEDKKFAKVHEVFNGKIVNSNNIDTSGVVYLRFLKKKDIIVSVSYSSGDIIIGDNKISCGSSLHCVVADETERFLYFTDIKSDKILVYSLDDAAIIDEVVLPNGCGPRHLLIHNENLYLVTEYSNEVYVFYRDEIYGKLEFIDKYCSYGNKDLDINYAAAIDIKDNVLAVSNRGKNVISFFNILDDGKLKYLYEIDCMGDWPRDIKFFRDYIFVANERSNEICVFKEDKLILTISKEGVNYLQIVEGEF